MWLLFGRPLPPASQNTVSPITPFVCDAAGGFIHTTYSTLFLWSTCHFHLKLRAEYCDKVTVDSKLGISACFAGSVSLTL